MPLPGHPLHFRAVMSRELAAVCQAFPWHYSCATDFQAINSSCFSFTLFFCAISVDDCSRICSYSLLGLTTRTPQSHVIRSLGKLPLAGMTVRWDFFVNAFDTTRYLPAAGLEGRENRNLAYVREFAAVVSILQVCSPSRCCASQARRVAVLARLCALYLFHCVLQLKMITDCIPCVT